MNKQIVTRYSHSRTVVFIASWLCYAGYYLCRLGTHSAESLSGGAASLVDASWALFFFGLAYTLSNFAAGIFADRYDGRLPALIGGLISAMSTALMATTDSTRTLLALQLLNGFGQGFGFPSLMKLLAGWFRRSERASVFGWWAGSYTIGSALSMSFAPWSASTHFLFLSLGWRRSFLWPSLLLAIISICFYFTTKDTPEKAGLPPLQEKTSQPARSPGWKSVLSNRDVQSVAAMYFFLKMIRYALFFGLPFYLVQQMHYDNSSARLVQSLFTVLGFVGAVLANHISDRYFQQRRYPVGATMLFALAFMTMLQPLVSVLGYWAVAINISTLGLLIYGTDSLMVSTCVLESVQYEESARAAAFVNGIGSIGQMLSPLLIVYFAHRHGWNNLFNFFMATALISGLILARNWSRYLFGSTNGVQEISTENPENSVQLSS
jgi:sugar phosphate permease